MQTIRGKVESGTGGEGRGQGHRRNTATTTANTTTITTTTTAASSTNNTTIAGHTVVIVWVPGSSNSYPERGHGSLAQWVGASGGGSCSKDHAVSAEGNPWPWGKTTTVVTGKRHSAHCRGAGQHPLSRGLGILAMVAGQDSTRCHGLKTFQPWSWGKTATAVTGNDIHFIGVGLMRHVGTWNRHSTHCRENDNTRCSGVVAVTV